MKDTFPLFWHLNNSIICNIRHFDEGELERNAVVRKFRTTATDGKKYNIEHYNLDMRIPLEYRIKSSIAIQFRQFLKGYVHDWTSVSTHSSMFEFPEVVLQAALEKLRSPP